MLRNLVKALTAPLQTQWISCNLGHNHNTPRKCHHAIILKSIHPYFLNVIYATRTLASALAQMSSIAGEKNTAKSMLETHLEGSDGSFGPRGRTNQASAKNDHPAQLQARLQPTNHTPLSQTPTIIPTKTARAKDSHSAGFLKIVNTRVHSILTLTSLVAFSCRTLTVHGAKPRRATSASLGARHRHSTHTVHTA